MRPSMFRQVIGFSLASLIGLSGTAFAQRDRDPEITVGKSLQVLSEITRNPKTGMPRTVMKNAHGIAIIPEMFKMSFIFGARFGRGVLVVRQADGTWGNPLFIHLAGGSFGAQAGAQSTDLVLVFQTQRGLDRFLKGKGKLTLGVDVGVAAGPAGKRFEAATDVGLKSEILSYSNSHGIFAGVSAEGGTLQIDGRANALYYQQPVSPLSILTPGSLASVPASAVSLQQMLAEKTAWPERIAVKPPRGGTIVTEELDEPSLFGEESDVEVDGALRAEPAPKSTVKTPRGQSARPSRPRAEPSSPDDLDALPSRGSRTRTPDTDRPARTNDEDLPEAIPVRPESRSEKKAAPAIDDDDDDAPELEAPKSGGKVKPVRNR